MTAAHVVVDRIPSFDVIICLACFPFVSFRSYLYTRIRNRSNTACLYLLRYQLLIHMLNVVRYSLWEAELDFGFCVQMLRSLIYYPSFAYILYRTLQLDSMYWTGGHLWGEKYQSLVIPSTQMNFIRNLDEGAHMRCDVVRCVLATLLLSAFTLH